MRFLFPVGALALIGGCYRPSIESCQYECFEDRCPDGLVCNAGGMCARATDEVCSPGPLPDSACGWPTASNLDPCAVRAEPGADWRISSEITIDTDDATLAIPGFPAGGVRMISMQRGGDDVALLAVADLQLDSGAIVTVEGNRPLAFLVHGTANIEGAIRYTFRDPASMCEGVGGVGTTSVESSSGGGGGGGGFGQRAGRATGGAPGGDSGVGGEGGAGGSPTGNAALVPLRGGCAGGRGGGAFGQPGAPGGGAIQISARDAIRVTGQVEASGGAPPPGVAMGGGGAGGGGAGGGILLESRLVELGVQARLCANGGGGGAVDNSSNAAEPGQCSNAPARGGGATRPGGSGGSLDADPMPGAGAGTGASGGAGGGGGVGRIRINGTVRGMPSVCSPESCAGES
ncbi:MAG: hypothetical protein ACTHU0_04185 [Kofleriaceae bacterium]